MHHYILRVLPLLLLVAACNQNQSPVTGTNQSIPPSEADAGIDQRQTQQVLEHHWETFVSNDLEGVMADYTEESVLITPDATYRGLAEIRQNFVNAFEVFPQTQSTLTLTKSLADQDIGYILWEADTPSFRLTYATDTFFIRNGKILRQTYAGLATPKP